MDEVPTAGGGELISVDTLVRIAFDEQQELGDRLSYIEMAEITLESLKGNLKSEQGEPRNSDVLHFLFLTKHLFEEDVESYMNRDGLEHLQKKLDDVNSAQKILDRKRTEFVRRVDEVHEEYKTERRKWEDKKALVRFLLKPGTIVEFNVSGRSFNIRIEDIRKYKSSLLACMFDGQEETSEPVYMQRDPHLFKLIMKFLLAQSEIDFKYLTPWSKLCPEESQELVFWNLDGDYKSKVPEPPEPR